MHPETADRLLRACFAQAKNHAFYRARFAGIDDCRDAPSTDKSHLRDALAAFAPGAEARGVYLVRSGGSTQSPLIFPVDIGENNAQRQAFADHLRRAGVFGPGTVALNVFGYSDLYRTAAIMDDLLERCDATTLPMSAHARYEDMLAVARRFAPTHLLGTPSKLNLFANFLARTGESLSIPHLLYGGEPLRQTTLAWLRDGFGTRQVWSLYGGAETGIWAWSDASRTPGLFSVLPRVLVEVLAPDADGFGALAITNGYRQRFPVFRYRVGDVGRLILRDGQHYLELRGRDARSFQFDELTFDLDLFLPLVEAADAFQFQLHFGAQRRDALRLLIAGGAPAGPAEAIVARLAQLLRRPPGDTRGIEVRVVNQEALYLDPATTKSSPIVDFRR